MSNPEDELFRTCFSDPVHARSLLVDALSPEIRSVIDFDTLRSAPQDLAGVVPDPLFSARFTHSDRTLYLLLLGRRDSGIDAALAVLDAQARVWRRFRELRPDATHLPVLLVVVVHYGPRRWDGPGSLEECFDVSGWPAELRDPIEPLLPRQELLILDFAEQAIDADILAPFQGRRFQDE